VATSADRGVQREKLGLALSGGGFRASLFHLGVLRRMAELDILRDVEVLSTVSGGSVVGALYVLFLKKQIDTRGNLTRNDYLAIVDQVQRQMIKGIQLNLRLRLFMNPLGILRVLMTEHTLGRRMSRLYERYLYAQPVALLDPNPSHARKTKWWRPGYIPLRDVWFTPEGHEVKGIYKYNVGNTTKLPNLVLNATSLNSGRSFRFSAAEIGDSRLGLFRWDEIETELDPRKRLLELPQSKFDKEAAAFPNSPLYNYARWWRELQLGANPLQPAPCRLSILPGSFPGAELGALRHAKIAAWYLLRGSTQGMPVRGSKEYADWLEGFWSAVRRIDSPFAEALLDATRRDPNDLDVLLECVLQIYYLRSAQAMSPRLRMDYEDLALSEGVGASACFPPVFPPFIVLGIYDDAYIGRLALTDGGAFDNVGTATLLEEDCNYIIASDTGSLLEVEERAGGGRIALAARVPGILMERIGNLQNQELEYKNELAALGTTADGLYGLAYFHIESPAVPGSGCTTGLDSKVLGRIRNDLDAFGDVEIAALVNHGYDLADRHIRAKLGNSPFVRNRSLWTAPSFAPMTLPAPPGAREERILRIGHSRFFRALKLGILISWLFVAALVVGVGYVARDSQLSVSDLATAVADRATDWIEYSVPARLIHTPVPILRAIVLLGIIAWIAIWGWNSLIDYLRGTYPVVARRLAFVAKWTRSYIINLLWLLGLVPVWIALAIAATASSAYVFFNIPFLRKTRTR
jgi:predicted acylesterase/phospholipase RssA